MLQLGVGRERSLVGLVGVPQQLDEYLTGEVRPVASIAIHSHDDRMSDVLHGIGIHICTVLTK